MGFGISVCQSDEIEILTPKVIYMMQHPYLKLILYFKIAVSIFLIQDSPAIFYVHYTTY